MTEYRRLAMTEPPSANRLWTVARGRLVKSNVYHSWLRMAGTEIMAQRIRPMAGPVHVTIAAPKNGRRDIDGYVKGTLDCLVKNKVIEDDRMRVVKSVRVHWHDDPAMLVEIVGAIP